MSKTIYITNTKEDNKVINSTGNKVQLNLSVPMNLDDGKRWYMRVLQGSVVYCDPNITTANNLFRFTYNTLPHIVHIPVGLYDIKGFNATISKITFDEVGNDQLFKFVADEATSLIKINFYTPLTSIDCTNLANDEATNVMSLFGFPPSYTVTNGDGSTTVMSNAIVGNFSVADMGTHTHLTKIGQYKAQLNTVQNILVRCNLVQGAYLNNNLDSVIASIFTDAKPWETIYYKPFFPPKCPVNVKNIYQVTFELIDQDGAPIDFNSDGTDPTSERWALEIEIFSE